MGSDQTTAYMTHVQSCIRVGAVPLPQHMFTMFVSHAMIQSKSHEVLGERVEKVVAIALATKHDSGTD